jgi:hypothetical protein
MRRRGHVARDALAAGAEEAVQGHRLDVAGFGRFEGEPRRLRGIGLGLRGGREQAARLGAGEALEVECRQQHLASPSPALAAAAVQRAASLGLGGTPSPRM